LNDQLTLEISHARHEQHSISQINTGALVFYAPDFDEAQVLESEECDGVSENKGFECHAIPEFFPKLLILFFVGLITDHALNSGKHFDCD